MIEVSTVFVAVTKEAGVFLSRTSSLHLNSELVTLTPSSLILHRSCMTGRSLTIPLYTLFLPLLFPSSDCTAHAPTLKVFLGSPTNFRVTTVVMCWYAGFSGFRLTECVNILNLII